mgnify:CR=1 FL=1
MYDLVSILVLLDVALKVAAIARGFLRSNGFNPCSLGCCSERVHTSICKVRCLYVSILVLLDVALKVGEYLEGKILDMMFQSLFSWMLL